MKTTKEKINDAFRALRKQGIVAKQNFSCCGNCAGYEMGEMFDRSTKEQRDKMKGCVFYTRQDTPAFKTGGTLYLRYGQFEGKVWKSELTTEQIGHMVVDALLRAGLRTTWDGNPFASIEVEVEDVVHQRRRSR